MIRFRVRIPCLFLLELISICHLPFIVIWLFLRRLSDGPALLLVPLLILFLLALLLTLRIFHISVANLEMLPMMIQRRRQL